MSFNSQRFRSLDRLPGEITALAQIGTLHLDNAQVTDLRPIAGLRGLGGGLFSNFRFANTPAAGTTPDWPVRRHGARCKLSQ